MGTPAFLIAAAAFASGLILPAILPSARAARIAGSLAAAIGSIAVTVLGGAVLAAGTPWTLTGPQTLTPIGGPLLVLDALGAVFLCVIGLAGVPAALYAVAYLRPADARPRGRLTHALLNAFLAGLCLVPAAGNVLTFLFGWELMAVASYLLIVVDPADDEAVTAGVWYAAMTHGGFLALVAAFLMLAGGGPLDFVSMREQARALSPADARWVFVLGLAAFGSKAGLVPLHVWLPRAHPAAPSHVSALMSAAMVKLGVYGALRLFFDLLPPGPAWWGGLVIAAGVATALTGVLYSVAESHLKRLLAYSTIENVGLIFVGLGFAMIMRGYQYPDLAAIGLVVCLLHTVNHAAYKTLLFLGAGAVVHATHATSLESYGGLIRRMPQTAVLCLIGALSLAALPPLNGFTSEWLTFQALVAGARHTVPELAIWLPLALAAVALVAGLAAVSAVRLFGITFLALPRTPAAAAAAEVPRSMRAAAALPALACLALGVFPGPVVTGLAGVAGGFNLPIARLEDGLAIALPLSGSRFWPLALVLVLGACAGLAALVLRPRLGPRTVRADAAWNCGRAVQSARTEYTAAAFAEPLKRVFVGFYRPTQQIKVEVHPVSPYFVQSIGYRAQVTTWMEPKLYDPILSAVRWASIQARRFQTGSIHVYLALLPAALVILLLVSRWLP
jgi:formate hydrogenlyase subunit 3/multisubunit Na+/H+ antiporter MnhD subunit